MTSCHRVAVCPPIARRALIIPAASDYVDTPVIAVTELHALHGATGAAYEMSSTYNSLKMQSSRNRGVT